MRAKTKKAKRKIGFLPTKPINEVTDPMINLFTGQTGCSYEMAKRALHLMRAKLLVSRLPEDTVNLAAIKQSLEEATR